MNDALAYGLAFWIVLASLFIHLSLHKIDRELAIGGLFLVLFGVFTAGGLIYNALAGV